MITRLELKNFTAFKSIAMNFSPKINVIIGENGTGKTHLLKAAYGLCSAGMISTSNPNIDHQGFEKLFTKKLLRLFMPLGNSLGRMCHQGESDNTTFEAHFTSEKKASGSFNKKSKSIQLKEKECFENYSPDSLFIPTKEVLSLMNAIASSKSDSRTITSIFDDTYLDLCSSLLKPNSDDLKERLNLDPRFGTIFPAVVNAIGGKYEFAEGRYYFHQGHFVERRIRKQHIFSDKTKTEFKPIRGTELSNNMTAEGFRKLGLLQQLLVNKSLDPGIGGPFFWDEPESNMNPKLIRLIVQVLLDLSRSGQQIILTTHDYVLLKWFDLLINSGQEDHILYHSLYRSPESREIQVETVDSFNLINKNTISDAFAELYDEDIKRALGL